MSKTLRIALAQYLHDSDPAPIVAEASAHKAEIVVFPEMFSNGYSQFDPEDLVAEEEWRAGAVSPHGSFVAQFREAAKANLVHVVATFLEASDSDPFNSACLIDPRGESALHHRKVHTCAFDTPEVACSSGEAFATAEIETRRGAATIGLLICMDREYPDAAWSLSRAGAEIALVPNCCDLASDPTVGDVRIAQMRGRAFETVMGIAVANYPSPRCDGHSFAVDPFGEVFAIADERPGLVYADFDLDKIRQTRHEERFRLQS